MDRDRDSKTLIRTVGSVIRDFGVGFFLYGFLNIRTSTSISDLIFYIFLIFYGIGSIIIGEVYKNK